MNDRKFKVEFLPEAAKFVEIVVNRAKAKVCHNIRKAQITNDPELFKNLTDTIWVFRILYNKTYHRLFAFWDKRAGQNVVVLATHGLIKKTGKTPQTDLDRAERIRQQYLGQKN